MHASSLADCSRAAASSLYHRGFAVLLALAMLVSTPHAAYAATTSAAGSSSPVNNLQPSLVLTWMICTGGMFPTRDGATASADPILGEIRLFAMEPRADDLPGWMKCDGTTLPIAGNVPLFSVLGFAFGGDGGSTFALPDLRGRIPVGSSWEMPVGAVFGTETMTLTAVNLGQHAHSIAGITTSVVGSSQPFSTYQPSLALNFSIVSDRNLYQSALGWVRIFAFDFSPSGHLRCDGALLASAEPIYDRLASLLGQTYGGVSPHIFAVPNLSGRTPAGAGQGTNLTSRALGAQFGASSVTLSANELPSHSHTVGIATTGAAGGSGAHTTVQPSLALNASIMAFGLLGMSQDEGATGEVRFWAGAVPENGHWTLCNGEQLEVQSFQQLSYVIGTTFGGGETHFAVPDLRGRAVVGAGTGGSLSSRSVGQSFGTETVTLTTAQMPIHTHTTLNTAPVLRLSSAQTLTLSEDAGAQDLASYLDAGDTDFGQTLTWSVSVAPTRGTISPATRTASTAGSSTPIFPAALSYTPSANENGSDTFTLQVSDGQEADTLVFNVTINATADAPTATNLNQTKSFTEDGGSVALDDIVVTDPDAGDTVTATLTLSSSSAGSLSTGTFGSATSTFNTGTGIWTVTGSVADVNAALAAVAFTPAANWDQSLTVTAQIRDAANTGPANGTITLTATATADAPGEITDSNVAADTVAENASNGATVGITAQSVDVDGDTLTYSLTNDAGGRFAIGALSGIVTVADASLLNYESATTHSITVEVTDGTTPKTKTFSIAVTNVAPSTPTDANAADNEIAEGSANGSTVGITASASDPNGGAVTYSLSNDAGGRFAIDGSTGVVTLADASLISQADAANHTITVRAADAAYAASTQTFTINILAPLNIAPVAGLGTALSFEAARSEHVSVPDAASLDVGTGSFTIEAWFQRTATGYHTIAGKLDSQTGTGWLLSLLNDRLSFQIFEEQESVAIANGTSDTATLADSDWHHVAAVRDSASKTTYLYVDGFLRRTRTFSTAADLSNATPLTIGDADGSPFQGRVDDVRLWNVARSASQIDEYRHAPLFGTEAGLIGYWDFEDGAGTVIGDRSGHGHQGTLVGGNGDEWSNAVSYSVSYVPEETAITFRLGGTDSGTPADATAVIVELPLHGTLTQADGTAISMPGVALTDAAGNPRRITYTPEASHRGPDHLLYNVSDGSLDSANFVSIALVTYQVNDAPVATDDVLPDQAQGSGPWTISFATLLGNDSRGPTEERLQALTITALANPIGGTVILSGSQVTFTPTEGFLGAASFDYTVRDNGQTNGVNDFKTDTGRVTFNITDATAPDTTITSGPASPYSSPSATLTFSGDDGSGSGVASFEASLDGGEFVTAASPQIYTGLADGPHTFTVRAVDVAGNIDPTPASYTWTIDTTPPLAPSVTSPANGATTTATTPVISGTAESGATVLVFIDGSQIGTAPADGAGNWSLTTGSLALGSHTAKALAIDAADNVSPESNTNTFTVAQPALSIGDVSLAEGDSGTTTFNFTVSLSLPAPAGGVTFDIATADGTATSSSDYVAKSLTSQTIAAGSSSYTFSVTVNGDTAVEDAETFFVNVTNVSGASVADGQAQGTITNDDTVDLAVSITDSPDPVSAGGNLTYTISVSNNGSSAASAPSLSFPLPAGTTFVSLSSPLGWNASTPAPGADGTITATAASLASGASGSFTLVVALDGSSVGESISATATVSGEDNDTNLGNNSATATTAISRSADLSISIATQSGPAAPGTNGAFVATVTNSGPNAAEGVIVFLRLSGPASVFGVTATQGTASMNGNEVLFTAGPIPSGESATFTVGAWMAPNASTGAGLQAWGVVASETPDPYNDDNSVTFESIVGPALNPALAAPLGNVTSGVRVSENIYPAGDADVYSFFADAGDRVFIATATTASSDATNSSRDTLIRVVGSDGATVLEVDDDDGGLSSTSSSIAGLRLPNDGTYYIVVECLRPEAIIFPYELYVRLQSGTPVAESDASEIGQALTAEGWVAGELASDSEEDVYSIHLQAGETAFVSLDLDPERDGTGWDGYLAIAKDAAPQWPFMSYINGSDLTSDTPPSSEALIFTAMSSGTYYFQVGSATEAGNYQLSVTVLSGETDHAVTTYPGNSSPIVIPDGGEAVSTLTIENSRRIGRVRVTIDLSDELSGTLSNLDVHLTSPGGSTVGLIRQRDVLFYGLIDVVLDDAAAYAFGFDPDDLNFPSQMGDVDGAMLKPHRHSRLSWFSGQDAKGDWKLTVRDRNQNGDEFTLNSWSLIIVEDAPLYTGDVRIAHLEANFNTTDGGFTHSGTNDDWAYGTPAGQVIDSAHSGTKAWVTNLAGAYAATSSQTLTSPAIELTGVGVSDPVHLSWAMKYQLADASTTTAYVEVEEVGGAGSSRIVWRWLGPTMRDEDVGSLGQAIEKSAGWGVHQAVIREFAGKTIRLKFHLSTNDALPLEGWAIDDVSVVSYRDASTNTNLASLALSSGTLSPTFSASTISYTATVANSISSVTLTAASADANATISVNGTATASGAASGSLNLNVGDNVITTIVTAEDGTTTKTYTVTITRLPNSNADLSNLVLSSGTLTPGFASGTTSYAADVSNAVASITVTPTLAESTATVKVNDVAVASGGASGAINLAVGANTLAVVTTAQDGTTTKTYTIVVTRAASSNADLSALTLSVGTLSPTFVSGTTNYSASVTNATASITVTPTVADATATVKVNGISVNSGAASGSISLNVGANTVQVVVTAQNSATKTYTLTVTRAPATNSALAGLALSEGILSPAFVSGTTAYATDVSYATSVLTVTATTADTAATILINGQAATSGSPSAPLDLNPGSNPVEIVVTAQDGVTTTSYTVTVTRALGYHSADTDRNWRLSLLELTRVIELYNTRDGTTRTGAYHTDATTEDGFAAGTGTITSHHSADTNQDGRLSLLELTRVIELYNTRDGTTRTGEYRRTDADTEDGFAPGRSVKS